MIHAGNTKNVHAQVTVKAHGSLVFIGFFYFEVELSLVSQNLIITKEILMNTMLILNLANSHLFFFFHCTQRDIIYSWLVASVGSSDQIIILLLMIVMHQWVFIDQSFMHGMFLFLLDTRGPMFCDLLMT